MRGFISLRFWVSIQIWFIKLKASFSRINFHLQKTLFNFFEKLSKTHQNLVILIVLIKSALSSVIFAFIAVYLLSGFGGYISSANTGSYDNLLIAVASITGIFLSLYFTGLNTVIGSLYAKSPSPVRNLFVQERIGNFSVQFIIFLTLVSLGLLLLGVTLDIRPKFAVLFVVIAGCFAILIFAQLGKRAFNFFDPTGFSWQLLSDLDSWSKKATSKGLYFTNPSFQFYYHQNAEIAVSGFVGLNKIAIAENQLKEEALSNLISKVITAYSNYIHVKNQIPTKSRWFTYVNKYKNWYLPSEHYVHIVAQAKAELLPTSEPDLHWLENHLEEIEIDAIQSSTRDEITDTTFNILGNVFSQFTELGRSGEIQQALFFHSKIERTLITELGKKLPVITEPQSDDNDKIRIFGVIDVLCSYLVTLVAGFFSTFDNLEPERILKEINGHKWNKFDAPYTLGLPSMILPDIEDISVRLGFEYQVESKVVTPDWYITELIARRISYYIVHGISSLVNEGNNYFTKWINTYENEQQVIKSVVVINRGLEFVEKLRTLVVSGNHLLQKLYSLKFINLSWPEWKYDETLNIIEKNNKDLITRLASHLVDLSVLKRTDRIPDYFGKAIVIIGYECFRSLDENDLPYFKAIFKKFFYGCLLTYENLRETTNDWQTDRRLLALSEPLLDLFDMSGYALLYSEFHQNKQIWDSCKLVWDDFLKDDPVNRLTAIEAIYSYRKSLLGIITERDNVRTQWEMTFTHRLQALPKKYLSSGSLIGGYEVRDHPSEIISVVSGHGEIMIMFYRPDEIFIDLYLNKHPSANGVKFKIRNPISEALSRHKQHRQNRRKKSDDER